MADITSGEFRDFINTVRGEPDKGDCIVTGTVSRIESNRSAWVLIGDNAEATPCSMDVSAHVGDTVTVRIADHKATITGNVTSPATDDRTANRARKEAKVANDTADEALDESKAARASAEIAKQAADAASADAEVARQSAEEAATSASAAETAATQAISDAAEAKQAAETAQSSADAAQASANMATGAAYRAVAGLGQVQDVIGTLEWAREHGTYFLTEDTTVDPTKIYYTRSGTAPDYIYTPVAEPKNEELATYYELSMREVLSEFVGAHLALLNDGLHIVSDASGYYIVLSNDAMRVYDPTGTLVAEYGDDIELYQAGILALKLSDDGMKLFDGLGTDESNVIAYFNENGVVLGQDDINKTHANIFFDPDRQSGGFGVYNVDEDGVPSYTGIENGRLTVGGPHYDESNSQTFEATHQEIALTEGWMAPEVGMGNKSSGRLMFYGWDTSFGPTVKYSVDWNGNISTTGKITAKGDVIGRYHAAKADIDSAASSRSANHWHRYAQVRDTNDVQYAFVEAAKLTDGKVQNSLSVYRKINGADKYGSINVQMDNSGNISWTLSNPANFRSQLGLGNTTGALPLANGGTNATSASAARTQLGVVPTSLWSGNTNANITLSQSVANFKRVTIFYRDNDSLYSSVDVYDPLNKSVLLTSNYSGRYIKSRVVNLNGKAVNSWFYGQTDAVTGTQDSQNLIYITRVLGWSY